MERLNNLMKDRLNDSEDQSVQISVELYKTGDKFGAYLSHDGSSGVKYNNLATSNDVAKCVEDYLDSNL